MGSDDQIVPRICYMLSSVWNAGGVLSTNSIAGLKPLIIAYHHQTSIVNILPMTLHVGQSCDHCPAQRAGLLNSLFNNGFCNSSTW